MRAVIKVPLGGIDLPQRSLPYSSACFFDLATLARLLVLHGVET